MAIPSGNSDRPGRAWERDDEVGQVEEPQDESSDAGDGNSDTAGGLESELRDEGAMGAPPPQ